MNGISLMKTFQRAAGWCEAVCRFRCLTREQKTSSGHVVSHYECDGTNEDCLAIRTVETACQ
ncbi:MAG: hypothetical protein Q4C80_01530 [Bacillota bacterium]|nr:hypothetical protein [Bacillota bacterium]